MRVETLPEKLPEQAAGTSPAESKPTGPPRRGSAFLWTLSIFILLWFLFFALDRVFPYIKNGSDIIFQAKLRQETSGTIFPPDRKAARVLIFGNSKVLAGFLPSRFDQLAEESHLDITSFNSGFPGSDVFLPQLKTLCKRGQAPDVLLLTLPWRPDVKLGAFHFIADDHTIVKALFPFRFFTRDLLSFFLNARSHGGFAAYYRQAREDERSEERDRGYYMITEQSHFPNHQLPHDFHLASDNPAVVQQRKAPADGAAELGELNQLIRQYHIRCYFVPYYLRKGEAAVPPALDSEFAREVENKSSCTVLGPRYFEFPNEMFADQTHVNGAGALAYTNALFELVKPVLPQGAQRALQ